MRNVTIVKKVTARRRTNETSEDMHEGGLAGSRRPDHRNELAGVDVECHTPERPHRDFANLVSLDEVASPQQRHQFVVFAVGRRFLPAKL